MTYITIVYLSVESAFTYLKIIQIIFKIRSRILVELLNFIFLVWLNNNNNILVCVNNFQFLGHKFLGRIIKKSFFLTEYYHDFLFDLQKSTLGVIKYNLNCTR